MKSALEDAFRHTAKAVTLAAAMFGVQSAAFAGYVVDTGEPTVLSAWPLFSIGSSPEFEGQFQELGGSFTLTSAQTLTAVDGWIETFGEGGEVRVSLWAGAPIASRNPLFTTSSHLLAAPPHWETFGNLNWAVGPGTYSVTFRGATGSDYSGGMPAGAPSPLSAYYSRSTGAPAWQAVDSDIGVRVAVVSGPETYALMLAGLGIVGVALRRRMT